MNKQYTPTGKALTLLELMAQDPAREFTTKQAATVMHCDFRSVTGAVEACVRFGLMFWRKVDNRVILRGSPFPPGSQRAHTPSRRHPERPVISEGWATDRNDPRIGKVVPGWKPPQMVCTRTGA